MDKIKFDRQEAPALVFARRSLRGRNLEVSTLWYGSMRNKPDGFELPRELKRPFMNFKEARNQLGKTLGVEPRKIKFMAFKGQRTWYPKNITQLAQALVRVDDSVEPLTHIQENVFEASE